MAPSSTDNTTCYCDPPVSRSKPEQIAIDTDWPNREYGSDGLPLLDPEETTLTDPALVSSVCQSDDDKSLARSFRHSGWSAQRRLTLTALEAAGFDAPRRNRFDQCGSSAFVLTTGGTDPVFRIASNRCHDRFCVPCATEKRRIIAANLKENLPDTPLRLITLPLRGSSQSLVGVLVRLYACFRKLRGRLSSRGLLAGGIAFLEVTRNQRTCAWHPHLHVICQGRYVAQAWLRDLWLEITGDSFIVDIRLIRGPSEAAAYVLKYASKAISTKVWRNPAAFAEAIRALSGKRTFNTFGTWSGFNLSRVPETGLNWEYLDTLPNLIRRYNSGETLAGAILRVLTNRGDHDPAPSDLFDFP